MRLIVKPILRDSYWGHWCGETLLADGQHAQRAEHPTDQFLQVTFCFALQLSGNLRKLCFGMLHCLGSLRKLKQPTVCLYQTNCCTTSKTAFHQLTRAVTCETLEKNRCATQFDMLALIKFLFLDFLKITVAFGFVSQTYKTALAILGQSQMLFVDFQCFWASSLEMPPE